MGTDNDGNDRLVKTAVRVQHEMGMGDNLFMDAPAASFLDLTVMAANRNTWKELIYSKFGRNETSKRGTHKAKTAKTKVGVEVQFLPTTQQTQEQRRGVATKYAELFGAFNKCESTFSATTPSIQAHYLLFHSEKDPQDKEEEKEAETPYR